MMKMTEDKKIGGLLKMPFKGTRRDLKSHWMEL